MRPCEQAGPHRAAERVPAGGEARVGSGVRDDGDARCDALEQGVAGGPAVHGRGGGGVHRGGAAQPAASFLPSVRVLRVADIRPGVGARRQAVL